MPPSRVTRTDPTGSPRRRARALGLLLAPALAAWFAGVTARGAAPDPAPAGPPPPGLGLPGPFARRVQDRGIIDYHQTRRHRAEPGITPAVIAMTNLPPVRRRPMRVVKMVESPLGASVQASRSAIPEYSIPLRGFRAPILDRAGEDLPTTRDGARLSPLEAEAAAIIDRDLAREGLLPTLAAILVRLGPEAWVTNGTQGLAALARLGFPVDLAAHFQWPGSADGPGDARAVVAAIAGRLAGGQSPGAVQEEARRARFEFQASNPGFRIATESGEDEIRLIRMQAGGGWRDGLVPGQPIEVIGRIIALFPGADYVVHAPKFAASPVEWLASQVWPLQRRGQLVLCVEPGQVTPWSQDNGKAGTLVTPAGTPARPATLVPRYAALGEGPWCFIPGDSFLADTLAGSGHAVIASPLLFQGGNVLAARDPASGQRLLFINESSIHANAALGLSQEQVRNAFRIEFGVDRCIVLPSVSYHLDFDLTLRTVGTRLVAFVNHPDPPVRAILGLGLEALARHGTLDAAAARAAREDLDAGRDAALLARLDAALPHPAGDAPYPASLSRHFVAGDTDNAEHNLQVFLLAVDLLRMRLGPPAAAGGEVPGGAERGEFLEALRRLDRAREALSEQLRAEGLRLEPIPSLPDLHRGINYLNGLQHRDGFVMPAFGGFYTPLDQAARRAYQAVLGGDRRVDLVPCSGCQQQHGALHCLVAAYPVPQTPR